MPIFQRVIFVDHVIPAAYLDEAKRVMEKALTGRGHCNLKHSNNGLRIFGAGILNHALRVLFVLARVKNELVAVPIECLPDHNYDQSILHKPNSVALKKVEAILKRIEDSNVVIENDESLTSFQGKLIQLSTAQQVAIQTNHDRVIIGAPGTGKTVAAFEVLSKKYAALCAEDKPVAIAYVTKNQKLLSKAKKEWQSYTSGAQTNVAVDFCTYDDLISKHSEEKIADTQDQNAFKLINELIQKNKPIKALKLDEQLVLEEFRKIAVCNTVEDYIALGEKSSYFLHRFDESQRTLFWQFFCDFRAKVNHSEFCTLSSKQKPYQLVVTDESQQLNALAIQNIKSLSHEIVVLMDPYQDLRNVKSNHQQMIQLINAQNVTYLPQIFRSSKAVFKVIEHLIQWEHAIREGVLYKNAKPISQPNDAESGRVTWVNDLEKDTDFEALKQKIKQPEHLLHNAIVTTKEHLKEAQVITPLTFTVDQIGGLDFEKVILWKLPLPNAPEDNNTFQHRSKTYEVTQIQKEAMAYVHHFFVAASRAKKELIIIPSQDKRYKKGYTHLQSIDTQVILSESKQEVTEKPLSKEALQEQGQEIIERLKEADCHVQANALNNALGHMFKQAAVSPQKKKSSARNKKQKKKERKKASTNRQDELNAQLIEAIEKNSVTAVKQALKSGANPLVMVKGKTSVLHYAIEKAFHIYEDTGFRSTTDEIMKVLLEAEPALINAQDVEEHFTPLMWILPVFECFDNYTIDLLFEYAPNLNIQNKYGLTIAMLGFASNHFYLVSKILECDDVDFTLKNNQEYTVLFYAIQSTLVTCTKIIIEQYPMLLTEHFLIFANKYKSQEISSEFLLYLNVVFHQMKQEYAFNNMMKDEKTFKVDANLIDFYMEILEAIENNRLEVVKSSLKRIDGHPAERDILLTGLHGAIIGRRPAILKYLLEKSEYSGSELESKLIHEKRVTLLQSSVAINTEVSVDFFATYQKLQETIAIIVLNKTKNIKAHDVEGSNVLFSAILQKNKAIEIYGEIASSFNDVIINALIARDPTLISQKNYVLETPFILALDFGFHELAKKLLEVKQDLNAEHIYKMTPLLHVIRNKDMQGLNLLIQANVNFNYITNGEKTAFDWALQSNMQILDIVIKHSQFSQHPCNQYALFHVACLYIETGAAIMNRLLKKDVNLLYVKLKSGHDIVDYIKNKLSSHCSKLKLLTPVQVKTLNSMLDVIVFYQNKNVTLSPTRAEHTSFFKSSPPSKSNASKESVKIMTP